VGHVSVLGHDLEAVDGLGVAHHLMVERRKGRDGGREGGRDGNK